MAAGAAAALTPRLLCAGVPNPRVVAARLRHRELRAVPLLLHGLGRRPLVIEASSEAQAAGVGPGMALPTALSLCPAARALPPDEGACRQLQALLLAPLQELAPEVAGGLGEGYCEVRGLERLVGDEAAVAEWVHSALRGHRLPPRVGVSNSRFAARAAAVGGEGRPLIVPPGEEPAFVAPLPVSELPEPDKAWRDMKRLLGLLGIATLGQVARLGQVAMQAQFGAPGLGAWQIAAGQPAPLAARPLPVALEVQAQYDDPIADTTALHQALARLAEELAGRLAALGLATAAVEMGWAVDGRAPLLERVAFKRPTALAAEMLPALARRLESRLSGPLAELELRARQTVPLAGEQLPLFGGVDRARLERLQRAAGVLEERMARPVLFRVQSLGPNPLPERRYELVPV